MKKNFKRIILTGISLWILLAGAGRAMAMDRWEALSMLESGDNDAAIGRAGEVSRFQIKPGVWEKYGGSYPVTLSTNPLAALRVAQAIMRARCQEFERRFHRPPTDFEYYVLWNAPAQIQKPDRAVTKRAQRFCNLMAD